MNGNVGPEQVLIKIGDIPKIEEPKIPKIGEPKIGEPKSKRRKWNTSTLSTKHKVRELGIKAEVRLS